MIKDIRNTMNVRTDIISTSRRPSNPAFGIYKSVRYTDYGQCVVGQYKGTNIEVYTAKDQGKLKHKLFYVSDLVRNFIKSKLIYFDKGNRKVAYGQGRVPEGGFVLNA